MRVKANFDYHDTLLNKKVAKDEVIEVSEERGNVLLNTSFEGVAFASIYEEQPQEEVQKEVQEEIQDEQPQEEVVEKPKRGRKKQN